MNDPGCAELKMASPLRQENYYDCGLYAIYFATTFLSEPQKYIELMDVSGYIQPGHPDSSWFTSSPRSTQSVRERISGAKMKQKTFAIS